MIEPIVFASSLFFLLAALMLNILGILWRWSLPIAALLAGAVGYSALSAVGAI